MAEGIPGGGSVTGHSARVMIVEDERFFRQTIAEILAAAGFECLECADAESALGLAHEPSVGVVIINMALPPLLRRSDEAAYDVSQSSRELLRGLLEARPELRVIMLSAGRDREQLLAALREGACDHVAKPLHDEELVLAVGRAMENYTAVSECARLRDQLARLANAVEPEVGPDTFAASDAELVREVCEAVVEEVEPERVMQAALVCLARALNAAPVSLYLVDPDTGELQLECECDGGIRSDRTTLPQSSGLTGTVFPTGNLVAAPEPQTDPRFDASVDTAEDGAERPLLCVPLKLRGTTVGLFRAFPQDRVRASPRTGEMIAAALSAAIRSVLLYRSLLATIEEVALARRQATEGPPVPRARPTPPVRATKGQA